MTNYIARSSHVRSAKFVRIFLYILFLCGRNFRHVCPTYANAYNKCLFSVTFLCSRKKFSKHKAGDDILFSPLYLFAFSMKRANKTSRAIKSYDTLAEERISFEGSVL